MENNKRFLSDSYMEFGTISWYVCDGYDRANHRVEAEIRLTDCYKPITLDFNANAYRHAEKRLEKIDGMIKELQEFREAYVKQLSKTTFKK